MKRAWLAIAAWCVTVACAAGAGCESATDGDAASSHGAGSSAGGAAGASDGGGNTGASSAGSSAGGAAGASTGAAGSGGAGGHGYELVYHTSQSLRSVAVDDDAAFATSTGGVVRVDKVTLAATELDTAPSFDLALDATHVYFTRALQAGGGELVRMPKAGGAAQVLMTSSARLLGVALDATSVYVTELDEQVSGPGCAYRLALGGGAPSALACNLCNPQAIALSADDAWVANFNCVNGELVRIPLAGGAQEIIVTDSPLGVAAGAGQVYWSHHFGPIGQRAASGGPISITAETFDATQGMWADATGLYVSYLGVSAFDGKVARLAPGGALTELASGFLLPEVGFVQMGADSAHVYFAARIGFNGTELLRAAR